MPSGLSMKACRVHEFGPPETIRMDEIERPTPGSGEVLIKVKAAGVGPWDGWIRAGKSALPQPLPLTLGSDLAGVVEMAGPDVGDFQPGDEVYGVTNPRFVGAYAEYAIASAAMIGHKPSVISDVVAASVPVIAVTARQALFDQGHLKAGQTVLIHGAGGNVGAYAVQFARKAGLRTIATAGAEDIEIVRNLGADEVIDYRSQRFENEVTDVDVVIDLVGGETQNRSFDCLKPGGKLVSAVSPPDQELAEKHGVTAAFFLVNVTTVQLDDISRLIDERELRSNVGIVLPLSKAVEAHEMLEGKRSHPKGKIVLEVAG